MRAFFIVSCGCRGVRLEECTSRCTRRATRNTTAVLTRKLLVAFFRLFSPSPLEFELRDVDYIFPGEFLRPTRSLECNVCMYMIRLNGDPPRACVFTRNLLLSLFFFFFFWAQIVSSEAVSFAELCWRWIYAREIFDLRCSKKEYFFFFFFFYSSLCEFKEGATNDLMDVCSSNFLSIQDDKIIDTAWRI